MAVTKVINSESKQYKPVLTDMLVLDAAPTVNSLNGVTSDAVARAIAGASGEVPQVTENDNGKVLTAVYDEGGAAMEWAEAQGGNVDQTYDATSTNAQSGVAVAQAITASDKISTVQASQTEIDIDVKGNAPIKLIAEDYGSMTGPSTALSFSSATFVAPGGADMDGIHVVFDLPTAQTLPVSARITVNQDIVGSDTRYQFDFVRFGEAVDDHVSMRQAYTVDINGMISSDTTLLAGNYDVTLSTGNPGYSFTQVGFVIQGSGQEPAWSDLVNYIITNASTLFSMSVPTTVKAARLLPSATTIDENKVLTVNASGKPVWATPATPSVDEVPDVTSTDNGKVLTASYSGGQGSYSWQTAQGGGGGGGGASYTAGQGIAIDGNNAISVDASARDFSFGQRSSLNSWSTKYNFNVYTYPDSSVICTKDSYINLASETGNVHLVCDNTGSVAGNYAVCNANYAFSNWRLTSDVKIEISKTASDWTFTGNTFNIGDGVCYITIAGTTGSTITPNGETPVEITDFFGTAQFDILTNPNQLSLKTPIPTVDQSYSASSTHAQSGTAVAQAISQAGGGITWSKISGSSITTTAYSMTANFSYSIPSGKTALQVTLMLRLYNSSGSWSNIPKELAVKLKLGDGNSSFYMPVGTIANATNWLGGQPTTWMVSGTVVVPCDWYSSIEGIQLELPASGGSLPESYDKDLFVGIA